MHRQQKDKLVVLVLSSLDLLQHSLGLLQKDESLLETLLRNEIDGTLVQLVNDDGYLIYRQNGQ